MVCYVPFLSLSCVCKEGEIGDGRSCYKDLLSEINHLNSRGRFAGKLSIARKMFGKCLNLFGEWGKCGDKSVSEKAFSVIDLLCSVWPWAAKSSMSHLWTLTTHSRLCMKISGFLTLVQWDLIPNDLGWCGLYWWAIDNWVMTDNCGFIVASQEVFSLSKSSWHPKINCFKGKAEDAWPKNKVVSM